MKDEGHGGGQRSVKAGRRGEVYSSSVCFFFLTPSGNLWSMKERKRIKRSSRKQRKGETMRDGSRLGDRWIKDRKHSQTFWHSQVSLFGDQVGGFYAAMWFAKVERIQQVTQQKKSNTHTHTQ